MDNAPCYKCEDRHIACHDTCERFEKFHNEMERIKEERRRAQRARSAAFMPHVFKNIPRNKIKLLTNIYRCGTIYMCRNSHIFAMCEVGNQNTLRIQRHTPDSPLRCVTYLHN